jgi:hypothetical protein
MPQSRALLGRRLGGLDVTPYFRKAVLSRRDDVEIAVDVWLPANHRRGDRWPVPMKTTRYRRTNSPGWAVRFLAALHGPSDRSLSRRLAAGPAGAGA